MKWSIKLRHRIILLLIVLLALPIPAQAFNGYDPGATIDTYDTGLDLVNLTDPVIYYVGTNSANNHLVFTAHLPVAGASGSTMFCTWEITQSGSILGLVDDHVYNRGFYDSDMGLIRPHDDYDWWLFGGMYTDDIISFQLSSEGYFEFVNSDAYPDGLHNGLYGCKLYNDIVLVTETSAAPSCSFKTIYIKRSDGTINSYDSWNATAYTTEGAATIIQDLDILGGYDNTDYLRFIWTCKNLVADDTGKIYVGIVYANDLDAGTDFGEIKTSVSGSKTLDYIAGSVNTAQAHTQHLIDNYHVSYGYVGAAKGASGDADIGFEINTITPTSLDTCDIVCVGTGYVDDTADSATSTGIVNYGTHFGYFWNGGDDQIECRNISNAISPIDQTHVSLLDVVYDEANEEYTELKSEGICCRLGPTNFTALVVNDYRNVGANNNLVLITYENYYPPVVDTLAFTPLETTYNTVVDAAYYAEGEVDDIGSSDVTEWGFCYNTTGYPYTSDQTTYSTGTHTTPFDYDDDIWDLTAATEYYCRAYACNSSGTGYGDIHQSYGYPDYPYTVAAWTFAPLEISAGTITDISDNGHDITYSLLANPGSLTITMGTIDTIDWAYDAGTLGRLILFQDDPIDSDEFTTPNERTFTGLPGMAMINTQLDNSNIPQAAFWLPFLAACIIALGLAGFWLAGQQNILPMVVICGLGIGFGVTMGWFEWWYLPLYMIPAYALFIGQQSHGGSHL